MKVIEKMTRLFFLALVCSLIVESFASKTEERTSVEHFENGDSFSHFVQKRSVESDISGSVELMDVKHRTKRGVHPFLKYFCPKNACWSGCRSVRQLINRRHYRGKHRVVKCCNTGVLQMGHCRWYRLMI